MLLFAPFLVAALQRAPAPLDPAVLLPDDALVYVEAPRVGAFLARRNDESVARVIAASPLGAMLDRSMDAEGRKNLARFAQLIGGSTADGLAHLLAHGAGFQVGFARGKPTFAAVTRASDERWLTATVDAALDVIAKEQGIARSALQPADESEGTRSWYFGTLAFAQRADLFAVASSPAVLQDMLAREPDDTEKSLASNASLRAARANLPSDALAWAWVDVERFRATSQGQQALADLLRMAQDPGANYLLGTPLARLATGSTWTFSLRTDGAALELALRSDGVTVPSELAPHGTPPTLPPAAQPEAECVDLVIHRNFAAIYAQRVELFRPEDVPQISRSFAELSLFFGGGDVGEDILPKVGPWLRVVSRPVRFEDGWKPAIELPAAAFVVELAEPETTGPRIMAAFQTIIGVVNADRAQRREQPLLLALAKEGEVDVSVARPLRPEATEGIDAIYNLVPACARVGDRLILGTHEGLVRELVRDLGAKRSASAVAGERATLRGPAIAAYLVKNQDALVANDMLEKGHSPGEARARIDDWVTLARTIERFEVTPRAHGERSIELVLRAELSDPRPKTEPR